MADNKNMKMGIAIVIGIIVVGVILWLISRRVRAAPPPGDGVCSDPAGTSYMIVEWSTRPGQEGWWIATFYDYILGTISDAGGIPMGFQLQMDSLLAHNKINTIQYDCALEQWDIINIPVP